MTGNHAGQGESLLYLPSSCMVSVGRLGKSVGLKGGVRITLLTDFPEIFSKEVVFYIAYTDDLLLLRQAIDDSHFHSCTPKDMKASILGAQGRYKSTHADTALYLPLRIRHFRFERKIVQFHEITKAEESSLLCNMLLYSTIDDTRMLCPLSEGEFFYFDIIGMSVVENGVEIGIVQDIQEIANTYYLVLSKHFLIPYIDRYVLSTDVENRQIVTRDARLLCIEH